MRTFARVAPFVVVTALALPALAYRPPASTLVGKAMDKEVERGTKSLKLDVETVVYDASGLPRAPVSEHWWLQPPGRVRKESDDGSLEVKNDDKLLTRNGKGQADKLSKAPVDVVTDFLTVGGTMDADRGADRLLRDLKVLDVNTEVVSLSRFDGRPAYVIGGKPWETDKPSVWLDKDTLLLVRVVTTSTKGDHTQKTDTRVLGWGSSVGGNWAPASVEVWVDDKLQKRTVVKSVERNVAPEAALFDVHK